MLTVGGPIVGVSEGAAESEGAADGTLEGESVGRLSHSPVAMLQSTPPGLLMAMPPLEPSSGLQLAWWCSALRRLKPFGCCCSPAMTINPADLLLIDGNPLDDTNVLLNREKIRVVMKDGELHKSPGD